MIGQWNDVQADHQAYQTRWRTLGRAGGESAELAEVRDALAAALMSSQGLRWHGLQDAYGHTPRVVAADPPFFVSLPAEGGSIDEITLGGDGDVVSGGNMAVYAPLDCLICVGPATGDFAQLQADAESWYLPLLRFLWKNRTLGQTCDLIEFTLSHPDYRDVQWGGRTAWWYALRIPIIVRLQYQLAADPIDWRI